MEIVEMERSKYSKIYPIMTLCVIGILIFMFFYSKETQALSVVIFVIGIIIVVITGLNDDKKRKEADKINTTTAIENVKVQFDDKYISHDNRTVIMINSAEETLHLLTRKSLTDDFSIKTFEFSEIFESAIVKDETTVTKVSKAGLIGGAMVAGVVGALAANKVVDQQVKNVKLQIIVDDVMNPIQEITFFNVDIPVNTDNMKYKSALTEVEKWYKRLEVIIKRNEMNSKIS
ncbi:hypothetical protein ACFVRU_43905 [Streptomyces sp. NPDC057927]